jgi:hypothetical protein
VVTATAIAAERLAAIVAVRIAFNLSAEPVATIVAIAIMVIYAIDKPISAFMALL